MEQLKIKAYSRIEIAEITGKNPKGNHFARDVQTTLSNWGYDYIYSRQGVEITRCPETPEERLSEILIRKLNINIQINPKAFAMFLYAFRDIKQFESMPWKERAIALNSEYNVKVDERTLRNWCNKLIEKDIISKSPRQSFWKTEIICGYKVRLPVDPDAEEVKEFYDEQHDLEVHYTYDYISKDLEPKEAMRQARSAAVFEMWQKYQRCYYYCGGVNLTAFAPGEDDFLSEIYDLVEDIVFQTTVAPNLQSEEKKLSGKEEFYAQWYRS